MLRRAKRLRSSLDMFCVVNGHHELMLDKEQWRQIDYLLCLTQPFFEFTTALSHTKDATIHGVFSIYNQLFSHLELSIAQLRYKKAPWKQSMRTALYAAKEKLSSYYARTTDTHGDYYAIGTILAPQYKLDFFTKGEWAGEDGKWEKLYHQRLKEQLEPYKQRLSTKQSVPTALSSSQGASKFQLLLERQQAPKSSTPLTRDDKLSQYFKAGK